MKSTLMRIALVFFLFVFLFKKFVGYMKKEQNLGIESLKDTLVDKDNPVVLSADELEKLRQQKAEAHRHVQDVISKIPVIKKNVGVQIDNDALLRRREADHIKEATGIIKKDIA